MNVFSKRLSTISTRAIQNRFIQSSSTQDTLNELLSLLKLRSMVIDPQLDTSGNPSPDLYLGDSQDLGFRVLFGGQILAQALSAARYTVPKDRVLHSAHAYFLAPGSAKSAVRFDVSRIRDGGTFISRDVIARQNGNALLSLSCSFQKEEEGFHHQFPTIPNVPPPEELKSELEMRIAMKDKLPAKVRELWTRPRPLEVRPVSNVDWMDLNPEKVNPPVRNIWFRTIHPIDGEDQMMHRLVLAYASDFYLLTSALLPHGLSPINDKLRLASLDHAIHFHQDVKVDDWLLYSMHSPYSGGARGFATGRIFNRQGTLVASVCQEGLMRYVGPDKPWESK